MITLKQAQADQNAMRQFVAEHEGLQVEAERFEAVMSLMAGQGKKDKVSTPDDNSKDITQL